MINEYLNRMKHIAKAGGEIALERISNNSHSIKSDNSVLTNADIEISKSARKIISDLLATPDHLIIDEEDTTNIKYLNQSRLEKTPFVWALDPIDGTRSYSNHMPNFGISIGLLKNLEPWLGMVYFPMLRELFYSDGKKSFFVLNPFTENETKTVIAPIEQPVSRQSLFICNDSFSESFDWHYTDCQIMNPACAVLSLCWPAIGRGCGAFFGASIWDFAGSWPIFLSSGLSLRSYKTGQELTKINVALFKGTDKCPWRLREYYILSSSQNYATIKKKITPKY